VHKLPCSTSVPRRQDASVMLRSETETSTLESSSAMMTMMAMAMPDCEVCCGGWRVGGGETVMSGGCDRKGRTGRV